MIIQCQQCGTKYRIPKERVPEEGIRARCKECGHVMQISSSESQAPPEKSTATVTPSEGSWQCRCGTTNAPEADYCAKCNKAKMFSAGAAGAPQAPERSVGPAPSAEAPTSPLATWKSLLLVGALAVVLGVGISYALGYAVNRSITAFLTTIFK